MSRLYLLRPRTIYNQVAAAILAFTASNFLHAANGDVYETVAPGTKVTLQATADGSPLPAFQWTKEGKSISGATNKTLVLPSASTSDSGVYNAIATNSAGWALSHDLILFVGNANAAPAQIASSAPFFTLQPFPSATAPPGSTLTLSATAVGTPAPTYQWHKNGSPILGATNSSLHFAWLTANNAGTYTVVATNSAGSATSNNSVVTIGAQVVNVAPTFTQQPAANTSAVAGSSLTLSAAATGTPSPTYQWLKNGNPITGATNSSLSFAWISSSNAGTYSVVASNTAGVATSNNAVVTVGEPPAATVAPSFTVQPTPNSVVPYGSSLTLTVAAVGTPAPTYQWQKNGSPILGATNSILTFAWFTPANSGTYTVVATNSAGSTVSRPAHVQVQ